MQMVFVRSSGAGQFRLWNAFEADNSPSLYIWRIQGPAPVTLPHSNLTARQLAAWTASLRNDGYVLESLTRAQSA